MPFAPNISSKSVCMSGLVPLKPTLRATLPLGPSKYIGIGRTDTDSIMSMIACGYCGLLKSIWLNQ